MIELKYKSYKELPIGKYFEIKEKLDTITDSDSDMDIIITLIALLSDVKEDDIYNMPIKELNRLTEEVKWFFTPVKPSKAPKKVKIGEYTLVPQYDPKNISVSQYIDYSMYGGNRYKFYVECLCTFLIPEGHKYNDNYDVLDIQNKVKEYLSIEVAESFYHSFAKSSRSLLNRSLLSLAMSTLKILRKTKKQGMTPMRINLLRSLVEMKTLLSYLNGSSK